MKKSVYLLAVLFIAGLSFSACKSKQKVITIPNAHAEAAPAVIEAPVSEPEEVRDEKFTLDADERNTAVLNQKYHVVVGSFKNRDNAKGLQQTLNKEGNNAVIVVNEQGMYRVLIVSYQNYKEAREKINQIKTRFSDAWVLIQKQG